MGLFCDFGTRRLAKGGSVWLNQIVHDRIGRHLELEGKPDDHSP